MKKLRESFIITPDSFHHYKYYDVYDIFISDVPKLKWLCQVRLLSGRVCWICSINKLPEYIRTLDTLFTFY